VAVIPSYPQFVTRFQRDLHYFLKHRPDIDLESLEHATGEIPFDLGVARDNKVIHNRSGDRIFIVTLTGVAYIRTKLKSHKYRLRVGSISLPFKKLYLTNTAQAGKRLILIIGYEAFIDFAVSYLAVKILNVADAEINPSTEEKQDTTIAQLDIKLSALRDAITDSAAPKDLKDLYDQLYAMRGAATPKSLKELWDLITLINTKFNLSSTALRDAIRGGDNRTLTSLWDKIALVTAAVNTVAGLDFAEQTTLALIKAKTDLLASIPKEASSTPTTYNVVMTNADQEYDQALPNGAKQITFFIRDLAKFRYAWVTGKVATPTAPYTEVPSPGVVFLDKLKMDSKTLYFACATAGKIMQIEVLT